MSPLSPTAIWILVTLTGAIVEGVLAGSFVGMFCALGAATTALFTAIGLLPTTWQQCGCFAGVSILSVALARTPLLRWAESKNKDEGLTPVLGEKARVVVAMAPQASGEVSLHGAKWRAVNEGTTRLEPNEICRVARIDGLVVYVVATTNT